MPGAETVTLTVRIPKPTHTALANLARREVSSLNREILIAVRAHLDADKQRRTKR